MYFLNFQIDKKLAPVLRSAKLIWLANKALKPPKSSFDTELGNFILMVEGFQKHVPNLVADDARQMLESTQKVTGQVYVIRDNLKSTEEGNDDVIQSKLKYAIKALNRLEAMLHVAATKAIPVEKTPDYLQQELARMSQEAVGKSLTKQ